MLKFCWLSYTLSQPNQQGRVRGRESLIATTVTHSSWNELIQGQGHSLSKNTGQCVHLHHARCNTLHPSWASKLEGKVPNVLISDSKSWLSLYGCPGLWHQRVVTTKKHTWREQGGCKRRITYMKKEEESYWKREDTVGIQGAVVEGQATTISSLSKCS